MATQRPPSAHMTLENFTNYFIESIYDSPVKYKIINTSKTTLVEKDAEDVTMYEYLDDGTSKVKRIISLYDNDTAYVIKYGAEPGKFSKYLPVARQMIDSFQPLTISDVELNENQLPIATGANGSQIENTSSSERVETVYLSELPPFITVIASSDEI